MMQRKNRGDALAAPQADGDQSLMRFKPTGVMQ